MFSEEAESCGFVSVIVSFVMSGELSMIMWEVVSVRDEVPSSITTSPVSNYIKRKSGTIFDYFFLLLPVGHPVKLEVLHS